MIDRKANVQERNKKMTLPPASGEALIQMCMLADRPKVE